MNEKIIDYLIEYIQDNHGVMSVKRETIKRKAKIVNRPSGDIHVSVEFRGKRYSTIITKDNL